MPFTSYYATALQRELEDGKLPVISQDLDSVRTYGWELIFHPPVDAPAGTFDKPLTLAAHQASPIGFASEDIEIHRVNDRVYYPGKVAPDELVVTFHNLFKTKAGVHLYNWMQTIYDPVTGIFTPGFLEAQGNFKTQIEVLQLNHAAQPFTHQKLFGVYPKKWTSGELNYGTSDFHQIEVTFRYDWVVQEASV